MSTECTANSVNSLPADLYFQLREKYTSNKRLILANANIAAPGNVDYQLTHDKVKNVKELLRNQFAVLPSLTSAGSQYPFCDSSSQ